MIRKLLQWLGVRVRGRSSAQDGGTESPPADTPGGDKAPYYVHPRCKQKGDECRGGCYYPYACARPDGEREVGDA